MVAGWGVQASSPAGMYAYVAGGRVVQPTRHDDGRLPLMLGAAARSPACAVLARRGCEVSALFFVGACRGGRQPLRLVLYLSGGLLEFRLRSEGRRVGQG